MAELEEKILKLTEFVTVSELASMMSIQPTQVISVCMSLGILLQLIKVRCRDHSDCCRRIWI